MDASPSGVWAVNSQYAADPVENSIAFASKIINPEKQKLFSNRSGGVSHNIRFEEVQPMLAWSLLSIDIRPAPSVHRLIYSAQAASRIHIIYYNNNACLYSPRTR